MLILQSIYTQYCVKTDHLLFVALRTGCFTRLQQLIIEYIFWIPPNAEQCFTSETTMPFSRYQLLSCILWLLFTLSVPDMWPCFLGSRDSMKKWFNFVSGKLQFTEMLSVYYFISMRWLRTHFFTFWICPIAFKDIEKVSCVTFNFSARFSTACVLSLFNTACSYLSSKVLTSPSRSPSCKLKQPLLNVLNHWNRCDLQSSCWL